MEFVQGRQLSTPTVCEVEALSSPLSVGAAATYENAALSRVLMMESAAVFKVGPTLMELAVSPVWRLMLADLEECRHDQGAFRPAFLLTSARLYLAGVEAQRDTVLLAARDDED